MRLSHVFGAHFAAPLVCAPTTGGPLRKVLGFALIGLAIAGAAYGDSRRAAADPALMHFVSRPDLTPPVITIDAKSKAIAPGYIFLAPKKIEPEGTLIIDNRGRPIWFHPSKDGATDFRVQRYHGRKVLTWWEGRSANGIGSGHYVIYNDGYRRIAILNAGNGLSGDEHEFTITPRNTALITFYNQRGDTWDSGFQELAIPSGRVLFQWSALAHVPLSESYAQPRSGQPFDYFHINSVALDPNGNYLISARNTRTLYDINRRSGAIRWRLGGKRSDFAMGPGTTFSWQHDARWHARNTLSLFDNGANPAIEKESRALLLRIDVRRRTVKLLHAYTHPKGLLSGSQGNVQMLPKGHLLVGWGQNPWFTEFDAAGRVVFDGSFAKEADSYRVYRFTWTGHPRSRPSIAAKRSGSGVTVYASWNGATGVRRWQVLAGPNARKLKPVRTATRGGFETAIQLKSPARVFAVRAIGASGPSATSAAVAPS
jgi:Arylsulfotransferase (ASST)